MPLTGQAKTDYQREYMQRRRSNNKGLTRSNVTQQSVRPSDTPDVRPNTKPLMEECLECEHVGGDEQDRAVCAAVDGCVYDEGKIDIETLTKMDKACGDKLSHDKPEPQSHNPMMVGYVPPTD